MMRAALKISLCFLLAACAALGSTVIEPTAAVAERAWPQMLSAGPRMLCAGTSEDEFLSAVKVLLPNYDPTATTTYASPDSQVQQNASLRQEIADDLKGAFRNAPSAFRTQLCSLDGIYIDPTGCSQDYNSCAVSDTGTTFARSWGFRVRPVQSTTDQGKKYIALSAALWAPNQHASSLNLFEAALLKRLLGLPASSTLFTILAAIPNNGPEMTVLAALAHEFGHVLWYEQNVSTPGASYDPNNLCGGKFFKDSWKKPVATPTQWVYFNTPSGDTHKNNDFPIAKVRSDAQNGNGQSLSDLYAAKKPWASFFAALSPLEDYVEAFKFHVLYDANLTSLTLNIPSATTTQQDVPLDYFNKQKSKLDTKKKCF